MTFIHIRGLLLVLLVRSIRGVSVYEYFTEGGINQGLTTENAEFQLNGKSIKILSGSLHYFRVHPDYWRTRLQQYKAAGLNTIDVYIPWNLHEPRKDVFDFGDGNTSQFSPFLNVTRFIEMAWEEDLFVIFRPGPYICGEWEFGGMPSWLLHNHPMFFRSSFAPYEERAEIFILELLNKVRDLQFFTEQGAKGGPIIMTQIENEFGNYGYGDYTRDKEHLKFLKSVLRRGGIESLLFTSDTPSLTADWGNVDYELMTANFKWNSEKELARIKELRPDDPVIVTEFWPGWFDHWFEENHNILSEEDFRIILGNIFGADASVNFYMFFGGTNFGYMNGANILGFGGTDLPPYYVPDVTSYDYDAPITEYGHYTPKYYATKEMIAEYDPLYGVLDHPEPPTVQEPLALSDVAISEILSYSDIIAGVDQSLIETHVKPVSMEQLELNDGNGQSYGYLVYRKSVALTPGTKLVIRGHIRDMLQVMIDGVMVNDPLLSDADLLRTFGSWAIRDSEFTIPDVSCDPCTLDLLVENLGRANFGSPHVFSAQKKGLWEGDIILDGQILDNWEHIPLEVTGDWIANQKTWTSLNSVKSSVMEKGPKLLRGVLNIPDDQEPVPDSFFDFDCSECQEWQHGALFVNGFNVGRYYQAGPQKSLYIPGPLLHTGENQIVLFENYLGSDVVRFTDTPNYGPPATRQQGTWG